MRVSVTGRKGATGKIMETQIDKVGEGGNKQQIDEHTDMKSVELVRQWRGRGWTGIDAILM